MKRIAALLFGLFLCVATQARAEVCVILVEGEFSELRVDFDELRGVIWGKTSDLPAAWCLNLEGDAINDDYPTHAITWFPDESLDPDKLTGGVVEEEPPLRITPVVIWPRFSAGDWELVYSFWDLDDSSWHTISFVEQVDNSDDDTAPSAESVDDDVVLLWTRNGDRTDTMTSTGTLKSESDQWTMTWTDAEVVVDELVNPEVPMSVGGRPSGRGTSASLGVETRGQGPALELGTQF